MRFRANDCANIAPIQHRTTRACRKTTLKIHQGRTNSGDHRHLTGHLRHIWRAQRVAFQITGDQRKGRGLGLRPFQYLRADRTVKQPGIQMRKPEMRSHGLGYRTFARGRRPINSDRKPVHIAPFFFTRHHSFISTKRLTNSNAHFITVKALACWIT